MWAYVQIARPEHWFKNVFVLPGVLFALLIDHSLIRLELAWSLGIAAAAVCLAASSNYVINELLDAPRDRLHPDKCNRPVPAGRINPFAAVVLWIVLGLIALALGFLVNRPLGYSLLALLVSGVLYNVPPFRTKDLPFLDVCSEAMNNPIRMLIGWYATGTDIWPPVSLPLAYWALGAFLMAVKRLAEYRHINRARRAAAYRPSFRYYNEQRLLISIICYATACGMFAGVFIARYRLELVLSVPVFAVFMALYLRMGLKPDSPAQNPERLLRSRSVILASVALTALVGYCLWLDWPGLRRVFSPTIPSQLMTEPAGSQPVGNVTPGLPAEHP